MFGDGVDTTDTSIIWNVGETQGTSAQGETVSAPTDDDPEQTLKGEILELLKEAGGLDFLKTLIPDQIFVEDVKQEPIPDDPLDDDSPLPDDEEPEEDDI